MKHLFILMTLVLWPWTASARIADLPRITPENFEAVYQRVQTDFLKITQATPHYLRQQFEGRSNDTKVPLSAQEKALKQDYLEIMKQRAALDPMAALRSELKKLYLEHAAPGSFDLHSLDTETTRLAVGLVGEIGRLKGVYKSFFMPLGHNMLIDVGIRKRGACKHWAEDLLEFLKPLDREFFQVTWGEANPTKMNEHNVAVIIPKGHAFNEGLLVDPWRTSGKPFWIRVNADKHYRWQPWAGYGVF